MVWSVTKWLFGFIFLITQFPSLITHHSIFHIRLASSPNFHHSIFFTLFVGPYLSVGTAFFFFFFFFLVPKLTEANIYIYIYKLKKKKPELKTEPMEKKKERKKKPELKTEPVRKKKKNRTANPEKKKVKVVKSCGWYCLRVPHVCLITKMLLSYELWKLKTAKSCFQFP